MKSFKLFLVKEYYDQSIDNEAMIVLQKIVDMVDDGHVDYSDKSIKINVGNLVKDKKYAKLNIFIVKGNQEKVKIGQHEDDGHHTIFIYSRNLPKRDAIDKFLLKQEQSTSFKNLFKKFFDNTVFDEADDSKTSDYEKSNEINERPAFEKLYLEMTKKLEDMYDEYNTARDELDKQGEEIGDGTGHKEIFSMSISKLKHEYLGGSEADFKKKAIEAFGAENYKLLNPEYRAKLDSRMKDFYEAKIK